MLSNLAIHPTLPAADMARAKKFYEEKLGFAPGEETPGGTVYKCGDGSWFLLYPTPANAGKNPATYAGWGTSNLEAEVAELKGRGVVFEEYDDPKTVNSIATMGNNKAAWFKDSEGNTLGVVQMA